MVWIYNEKPIDKTLQFEFQKDGKTCSSFPFGLNFHGWRAAWVSYERDMKGTPEEEAKLKESYAHLCKLRDEVIGMGVLPAIKDWKSINPNID